MHSTPTGPDFERSPDQRVIPGGYQNPESPRSDRASATLLERLKDAITSTRKRRRGPGFKKPQGWAPWKASPKVTKDPPRRRRPSGYDVPDAGPLP